MRFGILKLEKLMVGTAESGDRIAKQLLLLESFADEVRRFQVDSM